MKLKPEQLTAHLKQPLHSAYWLSGDEPLLILEAEDQIRQTARQQGFAERLLFHTDNTFNPDELMQATQALSLFGDRNLIELRITGKVTEQVRKVLAEVLETPSPDHMLLISSGKIDGTSQKTKWFKTLEDKVQFIQFWPINIQQLPQWLSVRAKSMQLSIAPDALQFIAQKVDGNLLAARQELEKLSILFGSDSIQLEQVMSAVADSARWNVFDLADATFSGDSARAQRILNGLQAEGTELPVVLWAITKDLRAVQNISAQLERGVPESQAFRSQQIWDKRKPVINAAMNRISPKKLRILLQKAGNIDREVKGQIKGDPWASLSALVWSLSRTGDVF